MKNVKNGTVLFSGLSRMALTTIPLFAILKPEVIDRRDKNIMKKALLYTILSLLTVFFSSTVFAVEKSERISDREIIESLAQIKGELKTINQRIDGLDKRIDGLQTIMLGGFGILFSGMLVLVGFVLWDRRSALAPAVRKINELEEDLATEIKKIKELEERESMLEKAIKEYAQQEPKLYDILKAARLL
jgi:septal ring factor EnvC (AmiA/AmiB activator)